MTLADLLAMLDAIEAGSILDDMERMRLAAEANGGYFVFKRYRRLNLPAGQSKAEEK